MSDTTRAARDLQDEVIRRMTGAERLQLACEMSALTRELALARLRQEHPDWETPRLLAALLRSSAPGDSIPPQFR
ncbi:MAG TPA: hypothetical protein VF862_14245 [Gemmatimonadales bacterium]